VVVIRLLVILGVTGGLAALLALLGGALAVTAEA
jgi:hypothetical protein